MFEFVGHKLHIGGDVLVKQLKALTQVIEVWLAVLGVGKAVFGAFAVAGKEVLARCALSGEVVALVIAEFNLFGGVEHFL